MNYFTLTTLNSAKIKIYHLNAATDLELAHTPLLR